MLRSRQGAGRRDQAGPNTIVLKSAIMCVAGVVFKTVSGRAREVALRMTELADGPEIIGIDANSLGHGSLEAVVLCIPGAEHQ